MSHHHDHHSDHHPGDHHRAPATVSVRGRATMEVPPDFAQVRVALEAKDTDRAAATAGAALLADTLRGALIGTAGIEEVSLPRVSVSKLWRTQDDERVHVGFCATVRGHVKCDVGSAGAVVQAASAAGAYVEWVGWGLETDNAAHREVRIAAVAQAREAAEDFALAAGRPLGDLVTLADPGLLAAGATAPAGWEGQSFGAAPRSAGHAEAPELDLDPAPQTVTAAVEACYRLD